MKNLMKRIENLLDFFLNLFIAGTSFLKSIKNFTNKQVKSFIAAEFQIIGIMTLIIGLGFIFKIKGMVVLGGMIASIAVIIAWKATDLAVAIINSVAKITLPESEFAKPIKERTESFTNDLKSLLSPLLTLSMFLAFISAVVALKGLNYFTFGHFLIWGSIILFTSVFAAYVNMQTKIPGWLMFGFVIGLLITYHLAPTAMLSLINSIESRFTNLSLNSNQQNLNLEEITIPTGTKFYELKRGEFVEVAPDKPYTKGKIISTKKEEKSNELMYETIFPIDDNNTNYIGGKTYYVAVRSVKPEIIDGQSETNGPTREEKLQAELARQTKIKGVPKEVYLYGSKGEVEIKKVKTGDIVYFLSLEKIHVRCGKAEMDWDEAITQVGIIDIIEAKENTPLYISKHLKNTKVYYW